MSVVGTSASIGRSLAIGQSKRKHRQNLFIFLIGESEINIPHCSSGLCRQLALGTCYPLRCWLT